MTDVVEIAGRKIGKGFPVFTIAEIGINHNGDIDVALQLIKRAAKAGFDAVKFQKRTPMISVPPDQRNVIKKTPWGTMRYIDYRHKVEFGEADYDKIDRACRNSGIIWFASCWDKPSVDFIERYNPPCFKIASACLTDDDLLIHMRRKHRPVILSTGMSTMDEIHHAVNLLDRDNLLIAHSTSSYPCGSNEVNLRMIHTLEQTYMCPTGYSGHEKDTLMSCLALALGAVFIERHITLDCTMWGSDHAASLDPKSFERLILDLQEVEKGLGDGVKRVYSSELPALEKLRGRKNKRHAEEEYNEHLAVTNLC